MTPLSPLNPAAGHMAGTVRPGAPSRQFSFPPSRPLRPFAQPKPVLSIPRNSGSSNGGQKTKIIEAPKTFPGGLGCFVLNMTSDELARRA